MEEPNETLVRKVKQLRREQGIVDVTTELLEASHGRDAIWITIEHPIEISRPVHSDMEEDYDLASMPDDEVGSLSSVQIMAALVIAVSSDIFDESVGSPPSRVILFGDILTVIPSTSVVAPETSTTAPVISSTAPVVETTIVTSPTGLYGLVPLKTILKDSKIFSTNLVLIQILLL
ncbi:hypothetical protein Tco_1073221 [Tanacetum coccineum]